jgi:hypothetical protein
MEQVGVSFSGMILMIASSNWEVRLGTPIGVGGSVTGGLGSIPNTQIFPFISGAQAWLRFGAEIVGTQGVKLFSCKLSLVTMASLTQPEPVKWSVITGELSKYNGLGAFPQL